MITVPLFTRTKEIFMALFVVLLLGVFSLFWEYRNYQNFIQETLHVSKATVLNHYQKTNEKGRIYDVFKLKLDDSVSFYTVSWTPKTIEIRARVKVKFKVENLSFGEYLKGFYANSMYLYTIYEDDPPFDAKPLYRFVSEQHEDADASQLYQALFFATPLSKALRDDVQKWGIAHLVAISGFHLGVLSFILFFVLKPLYQFFQDRYFPYRNATADISVVVFMCLYGYMYLIDFTPSFLRAFVMSVIGFFFFSKGIKVISFANLAITALALLAFFPALWFSISFWFSLSGVFYIFLFLHHLKNLPKLWMALLLNVWVYILMMPVIHAIFPVFTPLQLTSPLSSIIFIFFYPLSIFLHLIGQGGILDDLLLAFLHVKVQSYTLVVEQWVLIPYIGLSLLAIRFRWGVFLVFFFALGSFFFIQ